MDVRPIRTEAEYDAALAEIDRLMDAPESDRDASDRLEVLAMLVKAYEDRQYPIDPPSPVEVLKFVMEQRGLSRKDLARAIGSEAHVSNVLRGNRSLSLSMIVRLNKLFGIPIGALVDRRIKPKPRGRSSRRGAATVRRSASPRRGARRSRKNA